jgi:RNA polymerase sigma factor (sigma-70 family)
VDGIRAGEVDAGTELYESLAGFKGLFARRLGRQTAADRYHDLLIVVITSIRSGALREPERLIGFARATARHMVVDDIRALQRQPHYNYAELHQLPDVSQNVERRAIWRERKTIANRIMLAMPDRDQRVLVRYYFLEDDARQICNDMRLSENQFRLVKNRAKTRFTTLMRRHCRLPVGG